MSRCADTHALCALLLHHPRSEMRWIGTEVERFLIDSQLRIIRYQTGIKKLLESLTNAGWQVDYEVDGQILGVKKNLHAISLEPGSQFEISAAPRRSLQELEATYQELDAEIFAQPLARTWRYLDIGEDPWNSSDQIELLPSPRYHLMDEYFKGAGQRGRDMMRLTCGLQINVDFADEKEGVDMFRCALRLVSVLSGMFANSPYSRGRFSSVMSDRHFIWKNTDEKRSGVFNMIFDEGFGLADYVSMAASIPMMYVYETQGRVVPSQGRTYKDLPQSLKELNALACLRQVFSEVRFKPCCVEVRGFDQQSPQNRQALTAMVVGVLYDEEARRAIGDLFKNIPPSSLAKLMEEGARFGLKASSVYTLCLEILKWAERGLKKRALGEEKYLEAAEEILRTTLCPAEVLLRQWGEEIRR